MNTECAVGIDVAKAKLDVVLLRDTEQHYGVFDNTSTGLQQLQRWLSKHCPSNVPVCLEATGQYSDAPAQFLFEAGYRVSVVNPARIKAFADSRLSRQKTDKTDAALIALFCQTQSPEPWSPPPAEQRELQAMVRYLRELKVTRQQEANRLTSRVHAEAVCQALAAHLAFLDQQIVQLQDTIAQHLQQHAILRQQRDLLASIPGLADTTIPILLAEIRDITAFDNAAQLAAYAGVTPRHHCSGSSVRGRTHLSKRGNASLRAALYFPAMVALRHNPVIRAFGERLRATGHRGKAIIVAAMRKLLHLIYGILKSKRPFDPNFAVQVQST